jgi:hypothetical protein
MKNECGGGDDDQYIGRREKRIETQLYDYTLRKQKRENKMRVPISARRDILYAIRHIFKGRH